MAARELLICATNPGGAARFDNRTSWFVQACLDMHSSRLSLSRRFDQIVESTTFTFDKDHRTHKKHLSSCMNNLAAMLLTLRRFPCAPVSYEEDKIGLEGDLFAMSVMRRFGIDDDNREQFETIVRDIFRHIEKAWLLFEDSAPALSPSQRLNILISSLASGVYKRWYDSAQRQREEAISPSALRELVTPGSRKLQESDGLEQSSFRVIATCMALAEKLNMWSEVLLEGEEKKRAQGFNQ